MFYYAHVMIGGATVPILNNPCLYTYSLCMWGVNVNTWHAAILQGDMNYQYSNGE